MLVLGLDTSGGAAGAAVADGEGRLLAVREEQGQLASRRLLPLVAAVLEECGARASDLTQVAAAAGPGSFTGLRVGLATAAGLVRATGSTAVAVPGLEALAWAAGAGSGRCVVALDAHRGRLFAAAFRPGEHGPERASPDRELTPAEVGALAGAGGRVVGEGAVRQRAALAALGLDLSLERGPLTAVRGVVALAVRRGDRSGSRFVPVYLAARGPDAA